ISSRSAISPRTRAIGGLSTREAVPLETEGQELGAAGAQRRFDVALPVGRPVAEQAAAAARATDFRRRRAGAARAGDQVVDGGGRDAGRQALPVLPLPRARRAHAAPVLAREGLAHLG